METTPSEVGAVIQTAGQAAEVATANAQQQYVHEAQDKSIAEAQLEVETTLDKCYHMLKQDVWREVGDTGKYNWVALSDKKKRVLTDEGVEKVIQTLGFYINKENLLSNFDEKMINRIMLTFRLALNANFFMKYHLLFSKPSIEECKEILDERLSDQKKMKRYSRELLGLEVDEEEITKEIMFEVERTLENEIYKIRENKKKENLMEWELLFEQISQMVLATLNRAWRGEERGSLRRHTSSQEVLGRTIMPTQIEGRRGWGRS